MLIETEESSPSILAQTLIEVGSIANQYRANADNYRQQLQRAEEDLKKSREIVAKQSEALDGLTIKYNSVRSASDHFHQQNSEARTFLKQLIENVKIPRKELRKAQAILKIFIVCLMVGAMAACTIVPEPELNIPQTKMPMDTVSIK